jgi:hypothetical protein
MHFYLRRIRHDLMGFQVEILGTPRIGFVWGPGHYEFLVRVTGRILSMTVGLPLEWPNKDGARIGCGPFSWGWGVLQ